MVTRVLVLGSTGMLGLAVCQRLRSMGLEVLSLDKTRLDARKPDLQLIVDSAAHAVINALGLTNRRLDQPEADFLRVNSLFPRLLADVCEAQRLPLIHISTDCVFKGDAGPYDEASPALVDDLYGSSKLLGEPRNAMVIRTSIIGPELHNHYSLMCWFLKQTGPVRGFCNHHWNGVTTYELARVLGTILTHDMWQTGLWHVHAEDLTKHNLLQLIAKTFGSSTQIVPVDDVQARDTRLRTLHPAFLQALNIAPMSEQLQQIRSLSDALGRWRVIP